MLINDFFTITKIDRTEKSIESRIKMNASHKIFEGHFPDNPITPGVVQIQLVKELIETALETTYRMKEMGRCKFMAILNPNEHAEIDIVIKHSVEDGVLKISAQGSSLDKSTVFFKFNARYA